MKLISGLKSVKFAQKFCIFHKFLTLEGTLNIGINTPWEPDIMLPRFDIRAEGAAPLPLPD